MRAPMLADPVSHIGNGDAATTLSGLATRQEANIQTLGGSANRVIVRYH